MKNLLIVLTVLSFVTTLTSQAIWTIKDPLGNEVFIHPDSSFLLNTKAKLSFYTIDNGAQNRNVLVTDGDTSSWLLSNGISLSEQYTGFVPRIEGEYVFRAGNVWYVTDLTPGNTTVFFDNEDGNNTHEYLRIFSTESLNFNIQNLIIEAVEKATGDTAILYHTTSSNTTIPFGKKLRIRQASLPGIGNNSGNLIIASVYDDVNQIWSEYGVYREYLRNLKSLHTMGPRNQYNVNFAIYQGYSMLVDHLDNGTKRAMLYDDGNDSFIDFTNIYFNGYTLLELQNVKWSTYGNPLEPQLSYNDYFWKTRDQSNVVKYFVSGSLDDQEIVDLRNAAQVDFMYSDHSPDSIFYYNYGNMQRGLMRSQIYNQGTKKDLTSVPFTADFKLKGFKDHIYFGRYNATSGQIEAIVKNTDQNAYTYIEATNGARISNPLDFEFIGDKVFIVSKTAEGNKLRVYDPDGIVAIPKLENINSNVQLFPNPTYGELNLLIDEKFLRRPNLNFNIYDQTGLLQYAIRISATSTPIDINRLPSGLLFTTLTSEGKVLHESTVVKSN